MHRLILSILIVLLLALPASEAVAQGPVYLPLITKGDSCMGFQWAVLQISDGETTVDLLKGQQVGFHLQDWTPAVAQLKGGGVYQESNLAPGRRPVFGVYDNANESLNLIVNGYDQDGIIAEAQKLVGLLNKARARFFTGWQNTDVYLKARAQCETNARYAEILNYSLPQLGNPYAQPFFTASEIASLENLTLGIERGHWLANPPGTGEDVDARSKQLWDYSSEQEWLLYDSLGAVPNLPAPTNTYWMVAVGSDGLIALPNASSGGTIYYSADKGVTWAQAGGTATNIDVNSYVKINDNNIIISDGAGFRLLRSTDQGATWAAISGTASASARGLARLNNGTLLAGNANDNGQIWHSTDNGVTWSLLATLTRPSSTSFPIFNFAVSPTTGTVVLHGNQGGVNLTYRSIDLGATWDLVHTMPNTSSSTQTLFADSQGNFYAHDGDGKVYKSGDDGQTWVVIFSQSVTRGDAIFVDSQDHVFIATIGTNTGNVYRSKDGGSSFVLMLSWADATGGARQNFSESDEGDIYLGTPNSSGSNGGFAYFINDAEEFGSSSDDKLYVTNHQKIAQLTHIFIDDGGVFSANLFPVSASFQMYPASPAVNDAIYFGIDTSLIESGPFAGLRFFFTVPAAITNTYTIVWEYWDGSVWDTMGASEAIQDNTDAGAGAFSQIGYNSVHWGQPNNWATTSVNSVTGYWVRARISAISGTLTPPTHGNTDIFAFNTPYAEILADAVAGELPAIVRLKVRNESAVSGPEDNTLALYIQRLVVGLRSYSRGPNFTAYLNASDEQNPFGVTVTAGTNTSFATFSRAATGRRAVYNPAGSEAMATRLTYTLDSNIGGDFYGRFHAYLRCDSTDPSDFQIRLQVVTGSGGVVFTSRTRQAVDTRGVIDFDEIKIPLGAIKQSEISDIMEIRVQASAASGTPNLNFYDLILIPTDEWAIDAFDEANTGLGYVGIESGIPRFLDVDSLTDFRNPIRAIAKEANANERVVNIYNPIANGEAILQAGTRQRLWFFAMKWNLAGTDWVSDWEATHSLQLIGNQRYLTMRGAN